MSVSLIIYLDNALVTPPIKNWQSVQVQGASPEVLESRTREALDAVALFNTQIQDPEDRLEVADADLAGAGDGHTFVVTITFVKSSINLLRQAFEAPPLSPSEVKMFFCMAAQRDAFQVAFDAMIERVTKAVAPPEQSFAFQQAVRGASKGTTFMGMVSFRSANFGA